MKTQGRKRKDISGLNVGNVVVLHNVPGKDRGQTLWKCQCSCGATFVARYCTLTTKTERKKPYNCGCLTRCKLPKDLVRKKILAHSSARGLFGQYVGRAKFKGIDFELTIQEFEQITKQNCAYCNVEPSQMYQTGWHDAPEIYVYNGIDRIDSSSGYVATNCLPCCVVCNRMKNSHDQTFFIQHIKKIYENLIAAHRD